MMDKKSDGAIKIFGKVVLDELDGYRLSDEQSARIEKIRAAAEKLNWEELARGLSE